MNDPSSFIRASWSTVFLEITSHCNFSCSFCPSDSLNRKKMHMKRDLWERIIKELGESRSCKNICFNVLGEPLLHPDIFDAIRMANSYGIWVSLYTNGSLLHKLTGPILENLTLGEVKISLQQIDPNSFSKRSHNRIKWEDYIRRIHDFIREADKRKPPLSTQIHFMVDVFSIGWNFLHLYVAHSEANELYSLLTRYIYGQKRQTLAVNILNPVRTYPIGTSSFFFIKHLRNWGNGLTDAEKRIVPKKSGAACDLMGDTFAILSDGTCTFCCDDYEGVLNLGNANENSLEYIFNGEKSRRLREAERKGFMLAKRCQICQGRLYDRKSGRPVERKVSPADIFLAMDHYRRFGLRRTMRKALGRVR